MRIARWSTPDGPGSPAGFGEGFVEGDRVVPFAAGQTVAGVLAAGLEALPAVRQAADEAAA
ncbi:MAG: hydroxylase, partial [Herbiconiux sp.]|nr:hydroxylase [Herbiconiux sp.]